MMSVYSEYGKLQEALHLFEEIPNRNTISWNILLSAYADYENGKKAIQLFWEMQVQYVPLNKVTFIIILHSCASQQAFFEGKKLHVCIIQNGFELDVNVGSALVNMYGKCGSLFDAWRIFEIVPRSMVSWNTLIATCARHGHERDAFRLFRQMQWEGLLPDEATFLGILSACANFCSLGHSKIVHGLIVNIGSQSDDVYNALLSTYAKCGNLECAWKIFLGMPKPSVISWNAMVVAYAQYGQQQKALGLFKEMEAQGVEPDKATFSIVLDVCGDEMAFVKGKETHVKLLSSGIELDTQLSNALVSMYGKFHWMEEAHKVIDRLPIQDIMTWTSLMCSYCQRGQEKEALCLLQEIKMQKLRLDQITFISVLAACANLAALETGRLVHVWITASMFELDIALCNALLNMYAKCGTLDEVVGFFLKMPEQDVLSWTTVIAAYAQYGRATEATTLFKYMQLKGVRPDSITFVHFLCGFCHGRINDGYYYFLAMTSDYGITPREDHCNSIIDSLGRGGQLDEAESMANNLPFEPSILPWTVLLNASIIHQHA